MRYRELIELIDEGENIQCEFKRKFSGSEKIAREMLAFANTKGGIILFGIDDDKNGYIDDMHGWSFIGGPKEDIKGENLEMVRIFRKLDPVFKGKTKLHGYRFLFRNANNECGYRWHFNPRYSRRNLWKNYTCLLYTSPSPRDRTRSRMPSSA